LTRLAGAPTISPGVGLGLFTHFDGISRSRGPVRSRVAGIGIRRAHSSWTSAPALSPESPCCTVSWIRAVGIRPTGPSAGELHCFLPFPPQPLPQLSCPGGEDVRGARQYHQGRFSSAFDQPQLAAASRLRPPLDVAGVFIKSPGTGAVLGNCSGRARSSSIPRAIGGRGIAPRRSSYSQAGCLLAVRRPLLGLLAKGAGRGVTCRFHLSRANRVDCRKRTCPFHIGRHPYFPDLFPGGALKGMNQSGRCQPVYAGRNHPHGWIDARWTFGLGHFFLERKGVRMVPRLAINRGFAGNTGPGFVPHIPVRGHRYFGPVFGGVSCLGVMGPGTNFFCPLGYGGEAKKRGLGGKGSLIGKTF